MFWCDDHIAVVFVFSDIELTKSESPSHHDTSITSKSMELSAAYSSVGNTMSYHNSSSLSPLYTSVAISTKPQSLSNPPAYDNLYNTNTKDYSSLSSNQVAVN